MKRLKPILFISIILTASFIFFMFCKSNKVDPNTIASSSTQEIYKEYCGGCHGFQLQEFKRLQSFEKSNDYLVNSISKGIEASGMPAFQESFSSSQINDFAFYIKNYGYEQNTSISATSNTINYEVVIDELEIPWSFDFLPNGDMLVAEKKGVLSRYNKTNGMQTISGLPAINSEGQGGLLDIRLHPNYEENGWLYISYSAVDEKDKDLSNTAIIRAKLNAQNQLTSIELIYKGNPTSDKRHHYGTRMVFDENNHIYFANGDRGQRDDFPQKLDNTNGKIHRLNDDGTIPKDNPFIDNPSAVQSIYSYGHRNPQGLAIHPFTGDIWEHEHGPKGGDEINIINKGANYGWPVVSYGVNYIGTKFTDITEKEGMEDPIHYYVPSIAPSGMAFLSSDIYPKWKNNLFIGSLKFKYLERLELYNNQVIQQEKLLENLNSRVRDVRMGPDGYLYVAIEGPGRILKILP